VCKCNNNIAGYIPKNNNNINVTVSRKYGEGRFYTVSLKHDGTDGTDGTADGSHGTLLHKT